LVVVTAAGWWWWTGRDDYQIQATLREARQVVVSAELFGAEKWLAALAYSRRTAEALAEGAAIGDEEARAHALAKTAVALADSGHPAESAQAAQRVLAAPVRWSSETLTTVAEALSKAGRFQEALETVSRIEPRHCGKPRPVWNTVRSHWLREAGSTAKPELGLPDYR
jgi:hypothetical protein